MPNVLPAAFIVLATYALIALAKSVVPGFGTLNNNAIRAIGYVICYAMAAVNLMVQQAVHWQDLWGLLPIAGALFSTSALLYHIGTDGPPAPGSAAPPPPATADAAPGTPVSVPSAPGAAWSTTTVSYGPPAEAPVGPSVAAPPPEPPQSPTAP